MIQGDSRSESTLRWTGYHTSSKPEREDVLWQKAALEGILQESKAGVHGNAHTNISGAHEE